MALMVGSARIDENGNINGGRPGDQTKKEVSTQKYYMSSKGWYCLRAKDIEIATKLANAMYSACSNDMIGYNQNDRNSVLTAQKNFGGLANITLPVNCDCSSLVRACVIQASNIDPGNFNTGNEVSALLRTGLFLNTKYIDKKMVEGKSHINFVIGGSYGLSDELKNRLNDSFSLSKMTFLHQMTRLILLEQIYRALKINRNETYHK